MKGHQNIKQWISEKGKLAVDLHCHSLCSDGSLSPGDLVALAAEKGIRLLSLTDHDTTKGLKEAQDVADKLGIRLISGIEFSSQWLDTGIHIVGLGFDPDHNEMIKAVSRQQQARIQRAEEIAKRLATKCRQKDKCPEITHKTIYQLACKYAGSEVPGRPHFASSLVELGWVKGEQEAFKSYLGAGKVGDVKAFWPEMATVINWVHQSGGVAVLAHPRKYNLSAVKFRKLLDAFHQAGGDAIEVLTSGQKPGDNGFLFDTCRRYGFKASVGSDFHHPKFAWTSFGQLPLLPEYLDFVWSSL